MNVQREHLTLLCTRCKRTIPWAGKPGDDRPKHRCSAQGNQIKPFNKATSATEAETRINGGGKTRGVNR
jgi:hypothetical protein